MSSEKKEIINEKEHGLLNIGVQYEPSKIVKQWHNQKVKTLLKRVLISIVFVFFLLPVLAGSASYLYLQSTDKEAIKIIKLIVKKNVLYLRHLKNHLNKKEE